MCNPHLSRRGSGVWGVTQSGEGKLGFLLANSHWQLSLFFVTQRTLHACLDLLYSPPFDEIVGGGGICARPRVLIVEKLMATSTWVW